MAGKMICSLPGVETQLSVWGLGDWIFERAGEFLNAPWGKVFQGDSAQFCVRGSDFSKEIQSCHVKWFFESPGLVMSAGLCFPLDQVLLLMLTGWSGRAILLTEGGCEEVRPQPRGEITSVLCLSEMLGRQVSFLKLLFIAGPRPWPLVRGRLRRPPFCSQVCCFLPYHFVGPRIVHLSSVMLSEHAAAAHFRGWLWD